jgi:hypothetical protein
MAVEVARGELVFLPLRDAELRQELRLVARRTMALDATQSHVAEKLQQFLTTPGEAAPPGRYG